MSGTKSPSKVGILLDKARRVVQLKGIDICSANLEVKDTRMNVKLKIFELASKVDQAQRLLAAYESIVGEHQWTPKMRVDDKIRNFQLDEDDRKGYVLLPLIPGYRSLCLRFCVLGHAFRTEGYEPIVLRDDKDLPARPELTVDEEEKLATVEGDRYMSKRYPKMFGIKTISIGDVLGSGYQYPDVGELEEEELRSFNYRGIDLSGCAKSSTKKYLKRYTLDTTDPEIRNIFEDFLRGGAMLADATRKIIDEYDLEAVLVNEVYYIQGKVPLELCHRAGIKAYTQGRGYHQGKLRVGRAANRDPHGKFADAELTSRAVETELTEEEKETINELMKKRESGDVTQRQYTTEEASSVDVAEDQIVGVFSNLLWDAALEPKQALYGDFYSWLDDTIETGVGVEDTHFVIKVHPAESISGTNESVVDWIDENHAPLPDNFTVLPPDTEVNTYALIRDLDAGAVYSSTVGLEMAFNGVPVVVGGYPPYHGFGITHDPSSKSEYRELLERVGELECDEEMRKRAQRFAYFLFICKQLDFPYLSEFFLGSERGVDSIEHEEIARVDSIYNSIVNQILNGEEVIEPECMRLK